MAPKKCLFDINVQHSKSAAFCDIVLPKKKENKDFSRLKMTHLMALLALRCLPELPLQPKKPAGGPISQQEIRSKAGDLDFLQKRLKILHNFFIDEVIKI